VAHAPPGNGASHHAGFSTPFGTSPTGPGGISAGARFDNRPAVG
jgi:hypothetical protein